ncbi:hypothetical protein ERX37_06035 [Macrococcus hajekii]|uniref:GRAM domain-containing protein n=1 Tax=Macrococcus hajekii TaxID=198482 RepID=A0A4R6BJE2_9STAP|nr:GRAM domain-containing protein [Macrococcus hajekii]TDM01767.1 hypothetical protein ERX37_06035 [Macrococcus hajekii]GGB07269.1 hypothetical protein GCM10007190_14120 [Macrococcus hajekii]
MDYTGQSIAANYIQGFEGVGGKLHFSEDGMEFRPHSINIQKPTPFIPYKEIKTISKRNTLGLVPNGILVTTINNDEHKFVVYKRQNIIAFLQQKQH